MREISVAVKHEAPKSEGGQQEKGQDWHEWQHWWWPIPAKHGVLLRNFLHRIETTKSRELDNHEKRRFGMQFFETTVEAT